jgi:hypothetical protein
MNIEDLKLVIEMKGGVIQAIASNSETPLKIYVCDYDIEDLPDEDIIVPMSGDPYYGGCHRTDFNPAFVNKVIRAIKKHEH